MATLPGRILSNGMQALIEKDPYRTGFLNLVVDGTPQSQVNPDDPTELGFEYIQRIGNVIDLLAPERQAITAVHLGAGALTLPRYIAATRPGSRQQVLELEPELVELVREHLPIPTGIRVRYGDARAGLGKLPAALQGSVDLVVVDIFSGSQIPPHVTSVEFYREVAKLLAPTGVIAVNLADGPGLTFARGQAATLAAVVGEVAALAETQILKGRRFGNIVLIGSNSALPLDWLPRLLAAGPHPAKAVAGRELTDFIAGASVVTDASARPSPPPGRNFFAVDRGD